MDDKKYVTLGGAASAELVERKSRFIGNASPARSVGEALEFIEAVRSRFPDATHNVYAYELGGGASAKASDDGEPQGTAGVPVLDVIRKSGFTDAVIVVTRYFGGILLGVGGLVRAYSAAARLAVDAAGIVTLEELADMRLECSYQESGKLQNELTKRGAALGGCEYGAGVTLSFTVPASDAGNISELVSEYTGGKRRPELVRVRFGTL